MERSMGRKKERVMENKGCKELVSEVFEKGLCTLCGACAGGCPYLVAYRGRITVMDNCTLDDGQCYQYCPRTYTDMDAVSCNYFNAPYAGDAIGEVQEIFIARSADLEIRGKAQYGGTVTTLLCLALEEGFIDAAVTVRNTGSWRPESYVASSREEVLATASSNYIACPVLERLNRFPKESAMQLGIVVLPCQALALGAMKQNPPANRVDICNVRLTLGLFCTWGLAQEPFHKFLSEKVDLLEVWKFDIPPPPAERMDIYQGSDIISLPLDEVRQFRMITCAYCLDMTAEFADISVGSAEGIEGWNTVIIRTDTGKALLELARSKNLLETVKIPEGNRLHLIEAAANKKRRALHEIIKVTGNKGELMYLGLSPKAVEKMMDNR